MCSDTALILDMHHRASFTPNVPAVVPQLDAASKTRSDYIGYLYNSFKLQANLIQDMLSMNDLEEFI